MEIAMQSNLFKGRIKNQWSSGLKQSNSTPSKDRVICQNCGKTGHMIRDCWQKGGGKEGQGPSKFKKCDDKEDKSQKNSTNSYLAEDHAFEAYTAIPIQDVLLANITRYDWIADTGTTAHIAPIWEMFTDYQEISDETRVKGIGSTISRVVGKGTIHLEFDIGMGKPIIHKLRDVLHLP